MGLSLLLALGVAVIGLLPYLVDALIDSERPKTVRLAALIQGATMFILGWCIFYFAVPSLAWPLWGAVGILVVFGWIIAGCVVCLLEEAFSHAAWLPILGILLFIGRGCSGCGMFRAGDYAKLIGEMPKREWTQDVQPTDPKHIRLVPRELAEWLANKQLGEAPGAIGSQFHVANDEMTLQMIRGELWYVAPLDFAKFSAWTDADVSPGYVMVDAEDPLRPVIVKTDQHFTYMPGAYFGDDLERHLWNEGYYDVGLTDYTFEIDEAGKAWWVVTVFEPTIGWSGKKATGVAVVDPENGDITFYPLGKVPHWIDRAIPAEFVKDWIEAYGEYRNGWVNSWWGKKDVIVPEEPNIVYGSDGEPYWATGITSHNESDESLVGLIYTHARTGQSVYYRAVGGTDAAVLEAVNNKVSYRKWHGASPVLYNLYGTMASIVPLLGESHTFQGVAIVRVDTLQVAVGEDQYVALREYQKMLAMSGQQIAIETGHSQETVVGTVDRFAAEVKGTETMYYLQLAGELRLFTGTSELSPKLPLTRVGDKVWLSYIASGEDVVPLLGFDNQYMVLEVSDVQRRVREAAAARQTEVRSARETESNRGEVENMSDEELQQLLKLRRQQSPPAPTIPAPVSAPLPAELNLPTGVGPLR